MPKSAYTLHSVMVLIPFLLFLTSAKAITPEEIYQLFQNVRKVFRPFQPISLVRAEMPYIRHTSLLPPPKDFGQVFIDNLIPYMTVKIFTSINTPPVLDIEATVRRQHTMTLVVMTTRQNAEETVKRVGESEIWRSKAKVLLVIQDADVSLVYQLLQTLFLKRKAVNVTVMTLTTPTGEPPKFFTIFPYHSSSLYRLKEQDGLFWDKIPKQFGGYTMTAGVTPQVPFVLEPATPNLYTEGVEINAINLIAKVLNFKVKYITAPKGENPWVYRGPNNTLAGLFGLLDRGEADLLFHGVPRSYERVLIGEACYSHFEDSVHWVTPLTPHAESLYLAFLCFSPDLWVCVGLTYMVMTLASYLISAVDSTPETKRIGFVDSLLETFALTLSASGPNPKSTVLRIMSISFCMYSINITIAYNSILYKIYFSPRDTEEMQTAREAVDAGLVAYLYPSGKPTYNMTDHGTWNLILRPGWQVFSDDYRNTLNIMRYNGTNFAQLIKTTVEYEVFKRHLDSEKRPLLNIVQHRVLPFSQTFYFSRGHPLQPLFQSILSKIVEAGLIYHWKRRMYTLSSPMNAAGQSKLSIRQTGAAFLILIVLLVFATLAFVCEILADLYMKKRRNKKLGKI